MSKPRVIFFEPVKQNLHNAAEFGDVVYLTGATSSNDRPSLFDTGLLTSMMLKQLQSINYDPDVDIIATTGSILAVCILIATVASFYGRFESLCFNAKNSAYIQRRLGQQLILE